jgi:hypothetical protein
MTFDIYWSPEGRCIATVEATGYDRARRMTPQPYRKYMGEVYVLQVRDASPCTVEPNCKRHDGGCTG